MMMIDHSGDDDANCDSDVILMSRVKRLAMMMTMMTTMMTTMMMAEGHQLVKSS